MSSPTNPTPPSVLKHHPYPVSKLKPSRNRKRSKTKLNQFSLAHLQSSTSARNTARRGRICLRRECSRFAWWRSW